VFVQLQYNGWTQTKTTLKGLTTMKANTRKEAGKDPMAEMAGTTLKNYEQVFQTNLKLQGEAGRWWSSMVNQAVGTADWQKRWNRVKGMADSLMPQARERMEEVLALVEHNNWSGAELVKQAMNAGHTPLIADSQAKWMEFWTSSIGVARTNTEALTKISKKAIDSWIEFLQKNTELTEIRVPKAA
jgi:hypothetical protein